MTDSAITANLRLELDRTNNQFQRWSSTYSNWLTTQHKDFARAMEECDNTVQALHCSDSKLEEAKLSNMAIKSQQSHEIQQILVENESYKRQLSSLLTQLRHYDQEENTAQQRLQLLRQEHDSIRIKMEKNLHELTHGLRFYTKLGLEFQKADGDSMKFFFTQIDPSSPMRSFYFIMLVDDHNCYQLVETNPPLPEKILAYELEKLNAENDISSFVFKMRKLFCGLFLK